MSYFASKRLSYYRDLKLDIWGLVRNNLQYKKDRVFYNVNNIFLEARYAVRQSYFKKQYYKWNKFIVLNTVIGKRRRHWAYKKFIHENKIKSIFYFYILFYFFKMKITNRLYNIYKIFMSNNKKKYFERRYYYTPFIYEPRIYFFSYKRLKKSTQYLSMQLVRLFYIMYTFKQLKQLINKAKRSDFIFDNKFILLMECKLPSFIYRSSFFSNMFESINFINSGNLWINKKMVFNLYYTIKLMDFVGFSVPSKGFIYWTFFKRLRRKAFLFCFPKYMYISLVFFLIILIRFPLYKDIINPVSIDMYRAYHYT